MSLQNLLFPDMISGATPVNPGAGGWDTQINQFMADERGRQGYRLLSRVIGLIVPVNPGTALITLPVGWRCMPMVVMVTFTGAPPDDTQDYTFKAGVSTWHGEPDNFADLNNTNHGLLVFPNPGANAFTGLPQQTPFVDGDAAPDNLFTIERSAGGSSVALSFFTYGFAWQSND